MKMEASVDQCRGPDWMPITPKAGSLFHAETHLVSRGAAILVAGGPAAATAAQSLSGRVPIVFVSGEDPVQRGLVTSLNRPGGNLTGVSLLTAALEAKRLGLICELLPHAATIAALINSNYPGAIEQTKILQEAGRTVRQKLVFLHASSEGEIETAIATMLEQRIRGLLVCGDPFLSARRQQLVSLAARYSFPAIYERREHAEDGGLMSYGIVISDAYRNAGIYAARILKGEKAGDLPVMQSTKFEFIINLKTAKALGIEVPGSLLSFADEVIE
jgi:putative ABC transport system substrate-binding protein